MTSALLRGAAALNASSTLPPLLAAVAGPGSVAAAAVGGALLASLLWLQPSRQGAGSALCKRGLPAFALLGVTLSPLFLMPASPLLPASLASAALLGAAIVPRLNGARAPAALTAAACIAALTLAPMATACGVGAAVATVLAHGFYTAAAMALLAAAGLGAFRLATRYAPTAYSERFTIAGEALSHYRLEGLAPSEPSVFHVPPRVHAWVSAHQQGCLCQHTQCMVLSGPAGCGKTALAKGLAQALQATLVAPTEAELGAECIGSLSLRSMNLTSMLVEAYANARREGRPLVVLLDEAESLWGPAPEAGLARGLHVYVSSQQRLLAETARKEGVPLLFVGTTNHPERVQPPLDCYFVTQPAASQVTLQSILEQGMRHLDEELSRLGLGGVEASAAGLPEAVAGRLYEAGFTGRDAQAFLTRLRLALAGRQGPHARLSCATMNACAERALDSVLSQRRGPPPSARRSAAHTERLQRVGGANGAGLGVVDVARGALELLSFKVGAPFANPAQSARIKAALDRFSNASCLLAVWTAAQGA